LDIRRQAIAMKFDPRRLQAQCTGEQRFNVNAHDNPRLDHAPWACGQAGKRPAHMPTGIDDDHRF
jgi:hypothetical protein